MLTDAGDIDCDNAVIAAGAYSKQLAAAAGDRVPLETERGYHVVINDPGVEPRYPVMPSDGKMAFVMTPQGLRIGGQVELAGLEAEPNWKRAEVLRSSRARFIPDLPTPSDASNTGWGIGLRRRTGCRALARPRAAPTSACFRSRPCRADRRCGDGAAGGRSGQRQAAIDRSGAVFGDAVPIGRCARSRSAQRPRPLSWRTVPRHGAMSAVMAQRLGLSLRGAQHRSNPPHKGATRPNVLQHGMPHHDSGVALLPRYPL